jgi:hypothetical protein
LATLGSAEALDHTHVRTYARHSSERELRQAGFKARAHETSPALVLIDDSLPARERNSPAGD